MRYQCIFKRCPTKYSSRACDGAQIRLIEICSLAICARKIRLFKPSIRQLSGTQVRISENRFGQITAIEIYSGKIFSAKIGSTKVGDSFAMLIAPNLKRIPTLLQSDNMGGIGHASG